MAKTNKMISIDMELFIALEKNGLNVSDYCNEKLWDYITKIENQEKPVDYQKQSINEKMQELEKQKQGLEKRESLKEKMIEAGMTPEKIKFLENMSPNIMTAKDNMNNWEYKFGERLNWSELEALKEKWT